MPSGKLPTTYCCLAFLLKMHSPYTVTDLQGQFKNLTTEPVVRSTRKRRRSRYDHHNSLQHIPLIVSYIFLAFG